MNLSQFVAKSNCRIINTGKDDKELTKVFCCDLLSISMAKAPAGGVWVTVMGNVNSVAVAVLTELSCIILAEGVEPDETALERAKQQGVTILQTDLPVFDAALIAHGIING